MKKIITLALSLLLLLALLAGCGSANNDADKVEVTPEVPSEPTPEPTPEIIDLAGFIAGLGEKYEMPAMGDMDSEVLGSFYPGLSDIELLQCEGQMALISAVAGEIVLVQCADESDVAAVVEILEARKTAQVDGGAWYPETIAYWENTQIVTNGAYVALICFGDNTEAITADYNALFQ